LSHAYGIPVSELLRRWNSRELAELMALDRLDPMGSWRDDFRSASICAVIARTMGGKSNLDIDAFMPKFEPKKARQQTPEEMLSIAKKLTAMNKARLNRVNNR
jgi:hypothetical protein